MLHAWRALNMKCPKCQHENPSDARFCNGCGQKLELACPECGKSNPPGSKFCNGCSHNLIPTAVPPKELPLDEKRVPWGPVVRDGISRGHIRCRTCSRVDYSCRIPDTPVPISGRTHCKIERQKGSRVGTSGISCSTPSEQTT